MKLSVEGTPWEMARGDFGLVQMTTQVGNSDDVSRVERAVNYYMEHGRICWPIPVKVMVFYLGKKQPVTCSLF